eukprot:scaffold9689_cov116-Isochrysis_galbana.AAC.7
MRVPVIDTIPVRCLSLNSIKRLVAVDSNSGPCRSRWPAPNTLITLACVLCGRIGRRVRCEVGLSLLGRKFAGVQELEARARSFSHVLCGKPARHKTDLKGQRVRGHMRCVALCSIFVRQHRVGVGRAIRGG